MLFLTFLQAREDLEDFACEKKIIATLKFCLSNSEMFKDTVELIHSDCSTIIIYH